MLLRFVTACIREITATLVRFAAYCAILGGAVFGAWLLLASLFMPEEAPKTTPQTAVALPVHWLDGASAPPLRRIRD